MAVAAYASVLSLLRVLDNIQHPSRLPLFPDTQEQIHALREKLCSLQEFFENHSSTTTDEDIKIIVKKIPRVTYDAEILIDNYVVDRLYEEHILNQVMLENNIFPNTMERDMLQWIILVRQKRINRYAQHRMIIKVEIRRVIKDIESFNLALDTMRLNLQSEIQGVIEKIESANETLKAQRTAKDSEHDQDVEFTRETPVKNKMVGFEDQLRHVLDKLTGNQRDLVIVPIVGMGGIGKTTLARSLFDHPYNLDLFDVRIWLTISQGYNVRNVVQGLLRDGVLSVMNETEGDGCLRELTSKLHQKLFGQRYLIVLDDVWSLEAWNDLRGGFPNNGMGSRVIVTTRLSHIARSIDSYNSYTMKFLDEGKSWDLFSEIAFQNGSSPLELKEIGREISKRCGGLPLLLVVIGGLLASSNMKKEYWETVAKDIGSFANSVDDGNCLRILSLSYHHLPIHLKPCFLYMKHYDEDEEVKVSKLIERWISQGFVKPMRAESTLEEAARNYLDDLVGRNMLLIRRRDRIGNIKFCGIHDILRNLCIIESKEEQSFDVPRIHEVTMESTQQDQGQPSGVLFDFIISNMPLEDEMEDEDFLTWNVCSYIESEVTVTVTLPNIDNYVELRNSSNQMKPLDENKSWDLFREIAFQRGGQNLELEKIGREISKHCRGLPLLLVVIGGLLASSNMQIDYWETVAENISSFADSADYEQCYNILSLSYRHLPIHLKRCLLYMRHADENEDIEVSELITGWISRGLVKRMRGESTLEEAAGNYLKDLIGRNMLLVRTRDSQGNIKTCGIHDILSDFCIGEYEKSKDYSKIKRRNGFTEICILCRRRYADKMMFEPEILLGVGSKFYAKISVCSSCESPFPDFASSRFRGAAIESGIQLSRPVRTNCRGLFIDYTDVLNFRKTANLLWSLEIFRARKGSEVFWSPIQWKMPQLRHVNVNCLSMDDPLGGAPTVLENLQTLKTVVNFKCPKNIVRRIPNLIKLGLLYDRPLGSANEGVEVWSCFDLQNLDHLQKLESLSIRCSADVISMDFNAIAFPRSLKKLTLKGCKIAWVDLSIVGSLPNLQTLKLLDDSVIGEEWNSPNEGEFISLRCLELARLNLEHWNVDHHIHFEALETLVFERMTALDEIPTEIGELKSLHSIHLILCRQGIIDSARDIVEEQNSLGNETLVVHVEDFFFRSYQIGGC